MGDPQMRLARVREQIKAFDDMLRAGTGDIPPCPITVHIEPNPERTQFVLKVVKMNIDLPRLGVLLGELLHNLRATLDNLAWTLVPEANRGGDVAFPITDHPDIFKRKIESQLPGAPPKHVAIVEGFQPYNSDLPTAGSKPVTYGTAVTPREVLREPLSLLRELTNRDKHEVITPTTLTMTKNIEFGHPQFSWSDLEIVGERWDLRTNLELGTEFLIFETEPTGPNPEMGMEGFLGARVDFIRRDGTEGGFDLDILLIVGRVMQIANSF